MFSNNLLKKMRQDFVDSGKLRHTSRIPRFQQFEAANPTA
jgi:hypothetical protein